MMKRNQGTRIRIGLTYLSGVPAPVCEVHGAVRHHRSAPSCTPIFAPEDWADWCLLCGGTPASSHSRNRTLSEHCAIKGSKKGWRVCHPEINGDRIDTHWVMYGFAAARALLRWSNGWKDRSGSLTLCRYYSDDAPRSRRLSSTRHAVCKATINREWERNDQRIGLESRCSQFSDHRCRSETSRADHAANRPSVKPGERKGEGQADWTMNWSSRMNERVWWSRVSSWSTSRPGCKMRVRKYEQSRGKEMIAITW